MASTLVSAILPICDSARLNLARTAVNNFLAQYYRPAELVVVNATGTPVLTKDESLNDLNGFYLKELMIEERANAGSLRNIGIKQAEGSWILPLDDDDWFHPIRLMYQMAHRKGLAPSLLKFQLLIDVSSILKSTSNTDAAGKLLMHLHRADSGISSTILFPKNKENGDLWLYDEGLNTGEHSELLSRMIAASLKPAVCENSHCSENDSVSWPLLSVAVFHTSNELARFRFFQGNEPSALKPDLMTKGDMLLLKKVLLSYNFSVA